MRRGCAGLRLSISPAKLSASLQRSAMASEFTYSKLRSHNGRTVCSDGPPPRKNAVQRSRPDRDERRAECKLANELRVGGVADIKIDHRRRIGHRRHLAIG